jgi:DNA gyrase subunit A
MALFKNENENILTLTENGIGKVSSISEYRLQKRAGKGVFAMKITEKTGNIIGILKLSKENDKQNDILIISSEGKILRIDLNLLNITKRTTQGVKLIDLPDNEKVLKLSESNIEKGE